MAIRALSDLRAVGRHWFDVGAFTPAGSPVPAQVAAVDGVVGVVVVVGVPAGHLVDGQEPSQDGDILSGPHLDGRNISGVLVLLPMGTLPPVGRPRGGRVAQILGVRGQGANQTRDQVDRIPERVKDCDRPRPGTEPIRTRLPSGGHHLNPSGKRAGGHSTTLSTSE